VRTHLLWHFIIGIVLSPLARAASSDAPKTPYFDWNACPFECCTYQDWIATDAIEIHRSRSEASPTAFHLSPGETVRGLTGVVVTTRLGIARILKPTTFGDSEDSNAPDLSLQPGDTLYLLHDLGEGDELFWYRGYVYFGEIDMRAVGTKSKSSTEELSVLSAPEAEWWVKVRNKAGRIGWTNKTDSFENMDSCG
jgi:hypothetical protein